MFVISEISPQHSGDPYRAEQAILQSKLAGADAAKLQLYPGELYSTPEVDRRYLTMGFEELKRLKEYGDKVGMPVFATAFTEDRLEWCLELGLPWLKVAAGMHVRFPELVEKIISQGKPTFISIPSTLDSKSVPRVTHGIYFYCVADYPTLLEDQTMPEVFVPGEFDGFSDHSPGVGSALLACARGARYLEKHFTLDKSLQCATEKAHFGSMDYADLHLIKQVTRQMEMVLHKGKIPA